MQPRNQRVAGIKGDQADYGGDVVDFFAVGFDGDGTPASGKCAFILPQGLRGAANQPQGAEGQGVMKGLRVAGGGEVEGQEDGNIGHQPLQQARAGAVVVVQGAQWRTDTVEDVVGIDAAEAVLTEDMPGENEESDNQEEG